MTASSTRSEVEPDEEDGLARHDGLGDELRRLELEPLVDVGGRHARHPGDLEVVAGEWRNAERTRRSRAFGSVAAARTRGLPLPDAASDWQTRRRLRRAWAARSGREPVPEVAGELGEPEHGPSGSRQASHDIASRSAAADAHASASTGCGPGAGSVGRRVAGRGRVPARVRPAGLHLARPPLEVGALLGRRRPDRLEAVPLLRRRADGSRRARRRSAWVARWRSAGSDDATAIGSAEHDPEPAVRLAGGDGRQDPRRRLGGERRRAGRQRRPGVEQAHRDAVAAVAPVDQQAEQLAAAQHAEDRPQVAPRDERRRATARAGGGGSSNSSGNDESSATTLSGRPRWAIAAPIDVVVADVAGGHDDPAARASRRGCAASAAGSSGSMSATTSSLRHERDAHQLDEVAAVFAVRAQGQPADARVIRRQPQDVPEVPVGPGPLGRPEEVRAPATPSPSTAPVGPAGSGAAAARRRSGSRATADRSTIRRTGAPASVRRLESSLAAGHRAAVATLALVPAIRLTRLLDRRLGARPASRCRRRG